MMKYDFLLIDFDSTLVKIECLDMLARYVLSKTPNNQSVLESFENITRMGMEGKITLFESLTNRLKLISPSTKDIERLIIELRSEFSDSVLRQKERLPLLSDKIIIISGGFMDYMDPVIQEFGLNPNHIYANSFRYDSEGNVIGFDETNPLSQAKGKVKLVRSLKLNGTVLVIGDGWSDYEIKEAGLADIFIAFTENISRERVIGKADYVAPNFERVLEILES